MFEQKAGGTVGSAHHVPVTGSLPEFAGVCPREEGTVLLALVLEDGVDLAAELQRAQGDRHLDLVRLKLLPGASVQPYLAVPEPLPVLHLLDCQHDCLQDSSLCLGLDNGPPGWLGCPT